MQCKNDAKRSYTGKEPSPKGLGWCAHKMPLSTRKRGKDKKFWVVKATVSGVKRWVPAVNAEKRKENDLVSEKVDELKKNGFPHKQAVAIALKMKAAGKLGKKEVKKGFF